MTPYAVRMGYLPSAKIDLFERLRADVARMPDLDPPELVSCHAVCRALEIRHEGVRCVDGHFQAVGSDHSWLDLGDGVVADMYPIAATNPFMVDAGSWMIPWNRLYVETADLLERGNRDRGLHIRTAHDLVRALEALDLVDEGWTVHDGGTSPVGADELVDVRFMGYDAVRTRPYIRHHTMHGQDAGSMRWEHIGSHAAPGHHRSNITHWRRSSAETATA